MAPAVGRYKILRKLVQALKFAFGETPFDDEVFPFFVALAPERFSNQALIATAGFGLGDFGGQVSDSPDFHRLLRASVRRDEQCARSAQELASSKHVRRSPPPRR